MICKLVRQSKFQNVRVDCSAHCIGTDDAACLLCGCRQMTKADTSLRSWLVGVNAVQW